MDVHKMSAHHCKFCCPAVDVNSVLRDNIQLQKAIHNKENYVSSKIVQSMSLRIQMVDAQLNIAQK